MLVLGPGQWLVSVSVRVRAMARVMARVRARAMATTSSMEFLCFNIDKSGDFFDDVMP